jgi:MFS family permease
MRKTLPLIASLLIGMGIVQLGNGLLMTVISLRMKIEGFSTEAAGLVMSLYFAGQMLAASTIPRIIGRVGPVRTFAAAAAVLASAALSQILLIAVFPWAVLRAITGYGMAGLNMVAESWLNSRATNENRGEILALYMIMVFLATGLGQFLLNVADPADFDLFALSTVLIMVGLIPVALTRAQAPTFGEHSGLSFVELYRLSPLGVVGVIGTGLVNSSFYGLGPIFARDIGLDTAGVSSFMGITIIAGLAMQWPVGKLSDIYDRRTVLTFVFLGVAVISAGMVVVLQLHPGWTILLACFYGGLSFTTYSLSVAHACDFVEPKDLVKATGTFVFAYGIGAVLGPIVAAAAMSHLGPEGLFVYAAAINAGLVGFALYRMTRRKAKPKDLQGQFVGLPQTTSIVKALDPRALPEISRSPRRGHPFFSD